ncbi:hypothetical protein [Lutibacter sp.]|uniref:hypothetical protein n=1 Tax=Lutibacter sp. TaxID=1925666 RepID=UPI001A2D1353|nr:hypothetical protein [Lutibacter sp.]MBI9040085.1 hypothetical protein [Lutibacter sp.]
MLAGKNSLELLKSVETENLVVKLIEQLNKDFQLANINEEFKLNISVLELKNNLDSLLLYLITKKYDDYLNLLYRIDVSEKEMATINNNNLVGTIENITFLVLKREFQKVWFKNRT